VARLERGIGPDIGGVALKKGTGLNLSSWKGRPYVRKNRRRTGKPKTPLQQAWVEYFKWTSCLSKQPDPYALGDARDWAKGTGWYYRDVIERAFAGKLVNVEGLKKLTTPTANIYRTTAQALATNQDVLLLPNAKYWDNNTFWSPTINPGRLTVRSRGLYLVGAWVNLPVFSTQFRYAWMKTSGGVELSRQVTATSTSTDCQWPLVAAWYFDEGDYVELYAHANGASQTAIVKHFWIVAITPEAII